MFALQQLSDTAPYTMTTTYHGWQSVCRQGVTVVMTGGWDTVKLPISANNYFAIATPVTLTTDYNGDAAINPASIRSVTTNSVIAALKGSSNKWKLSILIIGTV